MSDDTSDDIYKQIFKLAWDHQPVKIFVITYLTFNILVLAMITIILVRVLKAKM